MTVLPLDWLRDCAIADHRHSHNPVFAMSSLILYEHPLSPYAQKCKISLYEKGVDFALRTPTAIGTGQVDSGFLVASPSGEVPALVHGDFSVFDSTVILALGLSQTVAPGIAYTGSQTEGGSVSTSSKTAR
jgi:hypothetical protein